MSDAPTSRPTMAHRPTTGRRETNCDTGYGAILAIRPAVPLLSIRFFD